MLTMSNYAGGPKVHRLFAKVLNVYIMCKETLNAWNSGTLLWSLGKLSGGGMEGFLKVVGVGV